MRRHLICLTQMRTWKKKKVIFVPFSGSRFDFTDFDNLKASCYDESQHYMYNIYTYTVYIIHYVYVYNYNVCVYVLICFHLSFT